jgi:hypothetical protein
MGRDQQRALRRGESNLTGLDNIDGTCAGVIAATAPLLPASRRMTVTCRRLVATVRDLVGAVAPRGRGYEGSVRRDRVGRRGFCALL